MNPEVWVVWPTVHVRESNRMTNVWRDRGYKVAVLINPPNRVEQFKADKVILQEEWKGFPTAANVLCHAVPGDVVVVVGDDVYPDKDHTAQELRAAFLDQFPDTMGMIQPIGDDFASTKICAVSPWIGRAFINEMYSGCGPFYEGYFHYWSDHELQKVAEKLECFIQWEDVTQFHDHWQRTPIPKRPAHLRKAEKRHGSDNQLFTKRSKKGFPGAIPAEESGEITQQVAGWKAWTKSFDNGGSSRESLSGLGSSLENTKEIREALPDLFKRLGIKTFTDTPCGDWHWMKEVDLTGIDYLGLDVIPSVVRRNRKAFPRHQFQVSNLVMDIPRQSDLILCRDLLFHLSNDMVAACLRNLKRSRSRWLLTTTFPSLAKNKDLQMSNKVGWRKLNLCGNPFRLPLPTERIQENDSPACLGRVVGLFDLEKI